MKNLMNVILISRNDLKEENILLEKTDKGNWKVFENKEKADNDLDLMIIAGNVISDEDVMENGLLYFRDYEALNK